ncbi:MAG: hypothetical protein DRH06_02745 [Deltaproteobacteria bacterium]|nr:MAG: hypothetical protein DRH06_02745 [Deltaproteobacteria bacterium]
MKKDTSNKKINGLIGKCGDLDVFVGFATASHLSDHSFADILQEETGLGYQRPYSKRHSLDFKKYISLPGASTPPLIFNLRSELSSGWKIESKNDGLTVLHLNSKIKPLAQVDCQHRLGELKDSDVPLTFMTFIGLDLKQEMAMFNVINGKAKGLSSSLTDYHESRLVDDLICHAPHLYIARRLNEDPHSPWFQMIRYGGEATSGLKRRTSLRMMQKAVTEFLSKTKKKHDVDPDDNYEIIANFWLVIRCLFPAAWNDHRHNLLTKGVGLYSLMQLLTDFVSASSHDVFEEEFFLKKLSPLKDRIDWNSKGEFASANGRKGANEVYLVIKERLGR